MRCPSCSKFAAYDTSAEPEVNVEVETELVKKEGSEDDNPDAATASVTGDCRIVLTAECCGDELKEATFTIDDQQVEIERAEGCTCDLTDLSVEASGEISDRSESEIRRTKKDGSVVVRHIPFRYQRRFYGASLQLEVSCNCGLTIAAVNWSDEVQASGMDELV